MFCVLTAACLALFAAACGTSGGGSTSGNGQTSESDSAPESVAKEELEIVSPKGEVFPYAEKVIEYLDAGEDANLTDYYYLTDNAFAPIVIEWKNLPADAKSVRVEYSTNEDMTDGESVTLSKDSTKLEVYNLLKATKYYVRVTVETDSGEKKTRIVFESYLRSRYGRLPHGERRKNRSGQVFQRRGVIRQHRPCVSLCRA